jgi:hypothetical protein
MGEGMEANQYAFVHGMARTRITLARWRQDPRPVLLSWFAASFAISVCLLSAVLIIAVITPPDIGFDYVPGIPSGIEAEHIAEIMGRNCLVLALHGFACVAGFIAGSALPLTADKRKGISKWIHDRARPVAFAWVVSVTAFSLITQALALGVVGSTLAASADVPPEMLIATALPHALLELTAVFLPLAAWTIASRRDEWDQLLAATAVTVAIALPMLLASAIWEVQVWPYLLRAAGS